MYIFVSSIGRSGTKFLSEVFKQVTDIPSFHGGELNIPDMRCCVGDALVKFNNNVEAEEIDRKIKQIQKYSVQGNYFESSQLFLGCFVEKAIKTLQPIYVIHLIRNPLETAKSYVNRNSIPGDTKSVWRPPIKAKRNLLQLNEALLTPFQKNLWNWLENELRFHSYKHQFQKTFDLDFDVLNKIEVFERLFEDFCLSYNRKKLIEILNSPPEKCNFYNANPQKTVISVDYLEEAKAFIALLKKEKVKLDVEEFNNNCYLKYEFINEIIRELSEENSVSQKKYSDILSKNSIKSETIKKSNALKNMKGANQENYNFSNRLSDNIIHTANQLKQQGKIAEALKLYDRITENNPNFSWGYIKKGEALLADNQLNEAIDNFRKAIKINPQSATVSYSLGMAVAKQNSYDAAVSCFRQAIKKCKTNVPQKFYTNLWEALAKQGKLKTTVSSEQGNNQWQVGVAKVAITPKKPIWMAGYAKRNKPSQGVVHDLWAKAIIILPSDNLPRILVTLDICGLDRHVSNRITNALEKQYGLEHDRIVLSFSHTHTGPVVGNCLEVMYDMNEEQAKVVADYTEFLFKTILDLVGQAFEQIKPASVAWGIGRANFAVNRSENLEKEVTFNRERLNLNGSVDHDVPVLSVRDLQGELMAIIYGYACHCTVLDIYQLTGDYAGFANIALEKQYPGAVAMFVAGCGADQNPIPRGDVTLAQKYGEELAQAVMSVVVGGAMELLKPRLNSAYYEVDLALSQLPTLEQIRKDNQSTNVYVARRAKSLLKQIKNQGSLAETYPYPIQLWQLGDKLNWIFMAGETVVEYSLKLKLNLGSSHTWVASYCNDLCSYIPTKEVLAKHGYEGDRSMIYYGLPTTWDENCLEEDIIDAVGGLLRITNSSYTLH